MRRYTGALVIAIWLVSQAPAAAFSPSDIEWSAAVTGTLHKGESMIDGDYTVKAVQFPSAVQGRQDIQGNWLPEDNVDPMVYLEVYKKGTLIKELIMTPQSETYYDPDYEAKIYATGFISSSAKEWIFQYYNPWATVAIETRAKPKLDVAVSTDKSAYASYDDRVMTATVTVTNNGGAVVKNIDVNLNIGELKLEGGSTDQIHKNFYKLDKGTSQSFSVILSVPGLTSQKSYPLSADARGYDVKDLEYKGSANSSITVSPKPALPPRITISKSVKNSIYLKDSAFVKIVVANGGTYDVSNLTIKDSMNEKFGLMKNESLQWDDIPMLKPGQEWVRSYEIKPLEASLSGFTIPAATVSFTYKNINASASSQTTNVIVNGPKIILNKTVNRARVNISEDVTVTVSINNVGNMGTKAEVRDLLPEGASLVSGPISLASTYLDYNKPQGFSYTIRMNTEGQIQLPAALANYTDVEFRGVGRAVKSSETPVVTVIDPSKIPPPLPTVITPTQAPGQETAQATAPANTPEPTPTPIASGFDIAVAAFALVAAAVYGRR
ncbi:MAG: hypothetical protein OIN66_17885 [Candidatus Methanoperedens sp.]|nr:hypothetical protein [Candidatus Methanoperedens sp.]